MSFALRLESIASPRPVEDEIADLPRIAFRLGLSLNVNVNGVELYVHPGDTPEQLVERWRAMMNLRLREAGG